MVQLRSYYSICPLIDRKSFLGVSEDNQAGCGVITLGRNVVTRYKFSDQKQVGGWTSKDHITAPVIFDSNEKQYVGVFNENIIKVWKDSSETLDGLKKHKFCKQIKKIAKDAQGKTTLFFKDGDCAALTYALYARKNLTAVSFLRKDEVIIDSAIFSFEEINYVCHITKQKNDKYSIVICELNIDINTLTLDTLLRVEVEREELLQGRVVGISVSASAQPPQVHIIWSDGRLFAYNLVENKFALVGHVPRICADVQVSLAWMGENHIALYGADPSQEGATLAVFNILFGVVSCSYPLKMFCKGARLWCLREHILLETTQNLAVVPFILSSHRNTLSLIGSHKLDNSENILMANWGKGKAPWKSKKKWGELAKKGMSEREICSQYLPPLLENNDTTLIKTTLEDFADIPENIIVNIISYVIAKFDIKSPLTMEDDEFANACNENKELRSLLDFILGLPYVKENMIPYLRKHFTLENMLFMIRYINYLLIDSSAQTEFSLDYEEKIILWSTILVDSHYQQFVISSEETTRKILTSLNNTIDNLVGQVDEVENVIPNLHTLCLGKNLHDVVNNDDTSSYYIEEIKIIGFDN